MADERAIAAVLAGDTYAELRARLEALAAEAEAGGDHPTAARIRDAIYGDDPNEAA